MTQTNAAKIEAGIVTDVQVVDSENIPTGYIDCGAGVGIGFDYDGTDFTPPAAAPYVPTTADFTHAVQNHLNARAQTMNYDNIFTAISYVSEAAVPAFQAEAVALSSWRSLVWAACYVILADVESEARTAPTVQELLDELDANVPYVPPA